MSIIKCLVIPADPEQPLRIEEMEASDLDHMQRLVGGSIEVVNLDNPPCSLYFNEEGSRHSLNENLRATAILYVGRPAFIGHTTLLGDAFITGMPDRQGDDTDAPEEMYQLLFHDGCFRIEVQLIEGGPWLRAPGGEYESWTKAYAKAIEMLSTWEFVEGARVIPA